MVLRHSFPIFHFRSIFIGKGPSFLWLFLNWGLPLLTSYLDLHPLWWIPLFLLSINVYWLNLALPNTASGKFKDNLPFYTSTEIPCSISCALQWTSGYGFESMWHKMWVYSILKRKKLLVASKPLANASFSGIFCSKWKVMKIVWNYVWKWSS